MNGLAWSVLAPSCLPFGMTLLNLLTWPRGENKATPATVSVLIPARDEEANIEACVRAALADESHVVEVIVYDDQSTDRTADLVLSLAAEDPRVRLLNGAALPPGWIGKPHACHRLAASARGDVLLFVDADTMLEDGGVTRILSLLGPNGSRAHAVTAVPRQDVGTAFEKLIVPLLILTYTSWFPLLLVSRSRDPRFLAANGQLLAVTRVAYDDVGGFESVKNELVDDMAFCRRLKVQGHRLVFADGFRMARCRMYQGARQVWDGFSKNLYEGIGATPFALAVVVALYTACFVLPYLAWLGGFALGDSAVLGAAAVGIVINVALRALLALRFAQPWIGVALHPISVLGLLAIAFNSLRWSAQNRLRWRGRTYQARKERLAS